ncbi:MAG TPA: hypothetical protein VFB76_02915 [Candidatus Angelobacter sp.]|nr:hypothetical protein [Candidatus Angelobacter sp.]
MRYLKYLLLLAALALPAVQSQAQVAIGVQIGPSYGIYNAPPVCEWGFYPTYPFACAPYGYYGPNWFVDGVFIGAGPWYNFYYLRPTYYRPFYFNRGFGFRGFERFHTVDRFGPPVERFRGDRFGRGFHSFNEPRFESNRGFDRDRGFRSFSGQRGFNERGFDRGRSFAQARGFHENGGREFRSTGGRSFNNGSGFRGNSGRSFQSRGGSSHSGGNHGGWR